MVYLRSISGGEDELPPGGEAEAEAVWTDDEGEESEASVASETEEEDDDDEDEDEEEEDEEEEEEEEEEPASGGTWTVAFIATLKDQSPAQFDKRLQMRYKQDVSKCLSLKQDQVGLKGSRVCGASRWVPCSALTRTAPVGLFACQVEVRDFAAGSLIVDTWCTGIKNEAAAKALVALIGDSTEKLLDAKTFGRVRFLCHGIPLLTEIRTPRSSMPPVSTCSLRPSRSKLCAVRSK